MKFASSAASDPRSNRSEYSSNPRPSPDCRDNTIKSLQVTLNLGMDRRFVLHTPLMWLDKAATWALAETLGGPALVELLRIETHSCYLGDRTRLHEWGYGCGSCPACELRRRGWDSYAADR